MTTTRLVPSTGLDINVTEHSSAAGKETVVLVHGYPDRQQVWDAVVDALPLDELHVVTYDVRGAGASGVPDAVAGYRSALLVEDLVAVLDAVRPDGAPVHLVGHDWGSIQLWDALAAEPHEGRLRGRLASFTSVSGPSLDHTSWLARHSGGRRARMARQLARSWYVHAFCVPVLPELVWRRAGPLLRRAAVRAEGTDHWGPEMAEDAAHGVNLYRANVPRRLARPGALHTDVPVLVVHPRRDRFLTGVLTEELDRWCSDLEVVEVDAGHWFPCTHPDELAALVLRHVRRAAPRQG
jgi:pimeloyl-ACP methyl ester carboxylesterase